MQKRILIDKPLFWMKGHEILACQRKFIRQSPLTEYDNEDAKRRDLCNEKLAYIRKEKQTLELLVGTDFSGSSMYDIKYLANIVD